MKNPTNLYIGVYISSIHYNTILDALEKTKKLGANVLQIYLGDEIYTTLAKKIKLTNEEIKICKTFIKQNKFKFFIHSILSLNLCKDPLNKRNAWAIKNIVYDMNLCYLLGGKGVILHMGTYKTDTLDISYEDGIKNFIQSLILILEKTKKIPIILETPVNKRYKIGSTIENLSEIYHNIPLKYRKRIKFCVDTQHIFASGYDIRSINGIENYVKNFDKLIGIKNLALIHLNDSKKEFDSHINRHESLREGFIFKNNGEQSLEYIINFIKKYKIPALLETNFDKYSNEIPYLKQIGAGEVENIINKQKEKKNEKNEKDEKDKIIKIFKTLLTYYQTNNIKNNITRYKIDSYIKAIKTLEKINYPIKNLTNLKNRSYLGKKLLDKIDEICKTGTLKQYENIIKKNIYSINKLNSINIFKNIWGVGSKLAENIVKKRIYSIKNLKEAVKNNKIKLSDQQKIGLKYFNNLKKKIKRDDVEEYTNFIKNLFIEYPIKIYNAGSFRSGKDYSGDIDIIVTTNQNINNNINIKEIFYKKLVDEKIIYEVLLDGKEKNIFIIKLPGQKIFRKLDVIFIKDKYLPWYLLYFGSSREFSKKIRAIASKLGYKLNEKGLFDKKTGKIIDFNPKREEDIFNFLGIDYIKPENRI